MFPPLPVGAAGVGAPLRRPGLAVVVEAEGAAPLRWQQLAVAVEVAARLRPLPSARVHLPALRATCEHTWRTLLCGPSCPKLRL